MYKILMEGVTCKLFKRMFMAENIIVPDSFNKVKIYNHK